MRVVRLLLLGMLAYIVTMVFLFPAAPLVERIKPNIQPVQLAGVTGKLFSGKVASVNYADDLLPLQFSNVAWKLAPSTLLKGGTGADVSFEGYGGGGDGQVARQFNGDLLVSNFVFNAKAKELEVLLPGPVAEFSGVLNGKMDTVELANNLLRKIEGNLTWNSANIVTRLYGPEIVANLGKFNIVIKPQNEQEHEITLKSDGGDLSLDGNVVMSLNGDYRTNLLLTPSANAPAELVQVLQQRTRADGGGRYRIQHSGNINQGT